MMWAVRRPESPFADATYAVTDLDTGERQTYAGPDLLEKGLPIHMAEKPTAKVFTYRRIPKL